MLSIKKNHFPSGEKSNKYLGPPSFDDWHHHQELTKQLEQPTPKKPTPEKLKDTTQPVISYIRADNFASYIPVARSKLESKQMKNRLRWERARADMAVEDWRRVIWSDESRFMVKGNDSDASVIRGFGSLVALEGSVDQDVYVDCLSNDFNPGYQNLNGEQDIVFTFQEDGASCHTGSYTTCPDLNPIEHVLKAIKDRITKQKAYINNTKDIKVCIAKECEQMDPKFGAGFVARMSDRIKAVIDARGGNTRY
ncbi:hypothetical protein PHYBLDRAFT_145855 [Phycomyces blakesleeanus NRRL 1555(-)]|uniref:Uncharacterized protein n=1 Tax=Phycomyces blakesleeanus (strain ATCC 8743b / DSM 1359 / FGSC 10004 / NBRC 33097 / NRRL 1555) TaxID=763407 RepID=A0A167MPM6_PHYB8|nr:hypothetical protein PHYBLDRAFT_145855 [Phycomyces blakesleeanus NRRL 1555(-)]OAD73464.1 hypothetical protein PHYBLDRAFT_145855 [Phycomyces blakesleeanus NRRL 1555(-)]|eukprot:XP_018291504.1 hypothetical protein PHYBLDRAFT_145855 [Phycomyces blakesleeanus NRRL 1555(-)]